LNWSDRIAHIYPAFKQQDAAVNDRMTLLDLLAHHSGLPEYAQMQLASGRFRGQQIIAAAALAETHKPHTLKQKDAEVAEAYGLGWFVGTANGETTVYHGGDFSSGAAESVKLSYLHEAQDPIFTRAPLVRSKGVLTASLETQYKVPP
jgi:CubicO group peptidase (beta-lactamase class C family)